MTFISFDLIYSATNTQRSTDIAWFQQNMQHFLLIDCFLFYCSVLTYTRARIQLHNIFNSSQCFSLARFFLLFYMNSSPDSLLNDAAITSIEDNSHCWFYEKGYSYCRSIRNKQSVQLETEVENELQFWQSCGLSFLSLDQWQKTFTNKVSGFFECPFQRTILPYRSYTGQLIMQYGCFTCVG